MAESTLDIALLLQKNAAEQGFDWPEVKGAWDKLHEEIAELQASRTHDECERELGDVLFSIVNLARLLNVDPDVALAETNRRFQQRFAHVLQHVDQLPPRGDPGRLAAMERRWQEAKRLEISTKRPKAGF